MANMTKKQYEAANAKLKNGFTLDLFYYMTHGEKTAVKRVPIGENTFACLQLMYFPEYERVNGYRRQTGKQVPVCHVSKEIQDGSIYKSFGLGRWVKIGDPQNRMLFSVLQKLSGTIDEELLVSIAMGEPDTIEKSKALFV